MTTDPAPLDPARPDSASAEQRRLGATSSGAEHWQSWGPYVSERAWGTVREDYSELGDAWNYLPHDHARSRAHRWSEDGLAAVCDKHQNWCLGLALWNGVDPILKERIFGLSGPEGNHGKDAKGLLVVRRLDTDPLVDVAALSLSAARVPLRGPRDGERPARPR